jgi:hypothetical protein
MSSVSAEYSFHSHERLMSIAAECAAVVAKRNI